MIIRIDVTHILARSGDEPARHEWVIECYRGEKRLSPIYRADSIESAKSRVDSLTVGSLAGAEVVWREDHPTLAAQ